MSFRIFGRLDHDPVITRGILPFSVLSTCEEQPTTLADTSLILFCVQLLERTFFVFLKQIKDYVISIVIPKQPFLCHIKGIQLNKRDNQLRRFTRFYENRQGKCCLCLNWIIIKYHLLNFRNFLIEMVDFRFYSGMVSNFWTWKIPIFEVL